MGHSAVDFANYAKKVSKKFAASTFRDEEGATGVYDTRHLCTELID
jgi:hypothetical protein